MDRSPSFLGFLREMDECAAFMSTVHLPFHFLVARRVWNATRSTGLLGFWILDVLADVVG